jgi:hypothetical protein
MPWKAWFLSVIICSPNISISVSCRGAKILQCKNDAKSLFWTFLTHQIPLLASTSPQHYRCHLSFCFSSQTLIITFRFFVFNGSSLLFYSLFSDSCLLLLVPTFSSLSSVGPHFFLPSLILSSVGPHFCFLWDQLLLSLFFLQCLFFSLVSQFMADWVRVNQHPIWMRPLSGPKMLDMNSETMI